MRLGQKSPEGAHGGDAALGDAGLLLGTGCWGVWAVPTWLERIVAPVSLGHLCLAELTVVPRGGGRGAVLSLGPPPAFRADLFQCHSSFLLLSSPSLP